MTVASDLFSRAWSERLSVVTFSATLQPMAHIVLSKRLLLDLIDGRVSVASKIGTYRSQPRKKDLKHSVASSSERVPSVTKSVINVSLCMEKRDLLRFSGFSCA